MAFKYKSQPAFTALILASIFHNVEEAVSICKYPVASSVSFVRVLPCGQFIIAVSIVTAVVVTAFIIASLTKKRPVYLFISTALAASLVLNVFVPHILIALYTFNYTPGLISAVTLILPSGLITLYKNKSGCSSTKQFYMIIGVGMAIGYLLFALVMVLVTLFVK